MWQIIFHCMDVPHLFTHSLADGHLGPFHVGAIMNNAAVNIHVQILYKHMFSVLLGMHPEVELLGHMAILCLIF